VETVNVERSNAVIQSSDSGAALASRHVIGLAGLGDEVVLVATLADRRISAMRLVAHQVVIKKPDPVGAVAGQVSDDMNINLLPGPIDSGPPVRGSVDVDGAAELASSARCFS